MANFGNMPESKNYVDRSAAPWYDPQKLLTDLQVGMQRVWDPKGKQAQLDNVQRTRDANPVSMSHQDIVDNMRTTLKRVPYDPSNNGGGFEARKPGDTFGTFLPDMTDIHYPGENKNWSANDPGVVAAVQELLRRKSR